MSKEEQHKALHQDEIDWYEEYAKLDPPQENSLSQKRTNVCGASPATGDKAPVEENTGEETPSSSQADNVPLHQNIESRALRLSQLTL